MKNNCEWDWFPKKLFVHSSIRKIKKTKVMSISKQFNHDFSKGNFKLYDQNNNEVYFENSDSFWSKQEYDQNNNTVYYEDSDGFWVKREYDQNNNRVYYENSDGYIKDNRSKPCKDKVVEIEGVKYKLSPL